MIKQWWLIFLYLSVPRYCWHCVLLPNDLETCLHAIKILITDSSVMRQLDGPWVFYWSKVQFVPSFLWAHSAIFSCFCWSLVEVLLRSWEESPFASKPSFWYTSLIFLQPCSWSMKMTMITLGPHFYLLFFIKAVHVKFFSLWWNLWSAWQNRLYSWSPSSCLHIVSWVVDKPAGYMKVFLFILFLHGWGGMWRTNA